MESEEFKEYKKLSIKLEAIRYKNDHKDSEEEYRHLEKMDDVWWLMTEKERIFINRACDSNGWMSHLEEQ